MHLFPRSQFARSLSFSSVEDDPEAVKAQEGMEEALPVESLPSPVHRTFLRDAASKAAAAGNLEEVMFLCGERGVPVKCVTPVELEAKALFDKQDAQAKEAAAALVAELDAEDREAAAAAEKKKQAVRRQLRQRL